MSLRHLTSTETATLELQGCRCYNWENIQVEDPFIVHNYRNVTFAGEVALHSADMMVSDGSNTFEAGITNATIIDCVIGRGVHISNIGNRLARCIIGKGALIRNVSTIDCSPTSTHGIGVEVDVLSETGGREVPIYYGISAQEAWLIAMCRHDLSLLDRLKTMIAAKSDTSKKSHTLIGEQAVVVDCGTIDGVDIKPRATVNGASRLINGTIGENANVGVNVIASDFIFASKSTVDSAANLDHVYVGEGSRIANGYSAHQSLIFSNCILENGEGAAIFAGPYTVSMHKSTLMIGCMTSMFNAGSGANQSNHLYKAGPCHQGILERGVKLSSDAYLMWPAHIGAFSTVIGRHKSHPDTSSLPFSYIIESEGSTLVIPAIALGNIGVARDIDKWPQRDYRPQSPSDIITFNLLNPYIAQRISEGIDMLNSIMESTPDSNTLQLRGCIIKRKHAQRAVRLYRDALYHYMIGTLLQRIADNQSTMPAKGIGSGQWLDIAGMIAPADMVKDGIPDISEWESMYRRMEWEWVSTRLKTLAGIDTSDMRTIDINQLINEWLQIDRCFNEMLRQDAEKEFDFQNPDSTVGFGLAGTGLHTTDFINVRGTLDNHPIAQLLSSRAHRAENIADAARRHSNCQ